MTSDTRLQMTAEPSHHHRIRYAVAGKDTVRKRATSRHIGACAPVTAARPRATSDDRRPTSAGSGELERATDRWVAARWYSSTSSSTSSPLSFRVPRLTRCSSRRHSALCAATKASTSTDGHTTLRRGSQAEVRRGGRVPLELVTGEAVALAIRVARLASRALALFVDMLLQIFILYICFIFVGLSATVLDSAVTVGLSIVFMVTVFVGYPAITETLTRGRPLGKLAV